MIWYHNLINTPTGQVIIEGRFENSTVTISANGHQMYRKIINARTDEVLAEDVLARYEGMAKKCEAKVPLLVQTGKIKTS